MNPTATYSKSRLIKELAFTAGIPQVKSRAVLEALRVIISREAALAPFILPGICKFDTAMRKERRIRNPRTGEALLLPAHKVVRLTPSKSLRQAVAPRVAAVKASTLPAPPAPAIEPKPDEAKVSPAAPPALQSSAAPVAESAPVVAPQPVTPPPAEPVANVPPVVPPPAAPTSNAPAQEKPVAAEDFILPDIIKEEPKAAPEPEEPAEPPAPAEPEFTVAPNGDITFHCQRCGQEIEAPADMAGTDAECPLCGTPIHVPTPSGQSPVATAQTQEVVSASEAETIDPSALKNKTIRIDATELGFDEPAPESKAPAGGDDSNMISFFCPGCHQEIEATADMAGTSSECPNCGTEFVVPFFSEKGTVHAKKEELFDPRKAHEQKHKTMRIDLDDF
jgi:nucleoid DNA-binding protein/DNA-directed RNA polymerase subunit RPC12/RpoP